MSVKENHVNHSVNLSLLNPGAGNILQLGLDTPVKFDATNEVDPGFIRASLRDFAQKLKDLERERDEGYAKVVGLEREVDNLEKDRNECEERLQILQKNLEDTEEGKYEVI